MFIAFFGAGLVVSLSLAYAGLVRRELSISKNSKATGTTAKVIGLCCLGISIALLAAIAWAVMAMISPPR